MFLKILCIFYSYSLQRFRYANPHLGINSTATSVLISKEHPFQLFTLLYQNSIRAQSALWADVKTEKRFNFFYCRLLCINIFQLRNLFFLSFFDVFFFFLSEASLSNYWKRFCVLICILTNLVSYQERQGLLLFKISCTIPIIQFPEITKHPAYPLGSEKSKYYSFAILFSISTWSICKNGFLVIFVLRIVFLA